MRSFQSRNLKRRWLHSRLALAVVFVLAVFLGRAAITAYLDARTVKGAYDEIRQDREELAQKKSNLENRLDYLSSSYGLEKELKRQFGLVKPGERVVVIVDRPEQRPDAKDGNGWSFFGGIKEFFKGFLPK